MHSHLKKPRIFKRKTLKLVKPEKYISYFVWGR